jgi:hypothetical protein
MICSHKYPKGVGMLICTECGAEIDVNKLGEMNG